MRKAPKYSPSARGSHWRRNREAELGEWGLSASEVVLRGSNLYFGVEGQQTETAAQLHMMLAEEKKLPMGKLTMANCIGERRVYTGAPSPCEEVMCKHVCDELMDHANLGVLAAPSVLAFLRQFIV